MIAAVKRLGAEVGIARACRGLGVPRSTYYRTQQPQPDPPSRPSPPRALTAEEKATVRAVLNSERFCNCAPREVYATLLDEDQTYLCHWRTMYRILHEHDEVHERRQSRRRPRRPKPELRATAPNQLWSWDITYLPGPDRFYYLYTIVDVFSRYVVGWLLATREGGDVAEHLIAATCEKQAIAQDQLTLHADRGSPMRAHSVQELMRGLGITESHSRPGTPTDNPYSEAHFKTLKYRPDYPERFRGIEDARRWVRRFVQWYHHQHHHTGLALMTPTMVHTGRAADVRAQRQRVLDVAYADHPERFVRQRPTAPELPVEVWINQPKSDHPMSLEVAGSAVCESEPGAKGGSRDATLFALEQAEHPATLERTQIPTADEPISPFELEYQLSQSH